MEVGLQHQDLTPQVWATVLRAAAAATARIFITPATIAAALQSSLISKHLLWHLMLPFSPRLLIMLSWMLKQGWSRATVSACQIPDNSAVDVSQPPPATPRVTTCCSTVCWCQLLVGGKDNAWQPLLGPVLNASRCGLIESLKINITYVQLISSSLQCFRVCSCSYGCCGLSPLREYCHLQSAKALQQMSKNFLDRDFRRLFAVKDFFIDEGLCLHHQLLRPLNLWQIVLDHTAPQNILTWLSPNIVPLYFITEHGGSISCT
jgi:hypothetical protein